MRRLLLSVTLLVLLISLIRLPMREQIILHYGRSSALPAIDCLPPILQTHVDYQNRLSDTTTRHALDRHGITIILIDGRWQYQPLRIARVGTYGLRAACEQGDPVGYALAVRHGDWLVNHARWDNGLATLPYDYPNQGFKIPSGHSSGMANGVASALLTQLYHVTHDPRYAITAHGLVQSFGVSIDNGGVRVDQEQGAWFEMVALAGYEPTYVLNGHLVAVETLLYTGEYLPSPSATDYGNEGIDSLYDLLPQFETEDGSVYALRTGSKTAPAHYAHGTHIVETCYLFEVTGDEFFKHYCDLWGAMR